MINDKSKINIAFMGTPEFAEMSLKCLIDQGYNIPLVITKEDKPVGRKQEIKMSAVKKLALENNLEVIQPLKVRNNEELVTKLKSLNLDFICVVAYGKILPKEILDIPKYGCINVHGSLLPKYRGSAPIQWSIINGEKQAGVTTMFMDVGMDTGDMLLKEAFDILEDDDFESVYNKLANIGGNLLVETIDKVYNKEIIGEKQGEKFSLAPMITKEITRINFMDSAKEIFNFVRGLNPVPNAYIEDMNGLTYKIGKVREVSQQEILNLMSAEEYNDCRVGSIINITKKELMIRCGTLAISILSIKPEGKKMMDIASFLNGTKFKKGDIFKW